MTAPETFGGWVILELMGHRRLAGYVQEVNIAGVGFLRLDVPGDGPTIHTLENPDGGSTTAGPDLEPQAVTQYYAPGSVYCITPVTEDVARAVAARTRPEPVHPYEMRALPPPARPRRDDEDDDEDPVDSPLRDLYR